MTRAHLVLLVPAADTALMMAAGEGGTAPWAVAAYAAIATSVVVLGRRRPAVGFALAVALASLTGTAYLLLLWAGYRAGRHAVSARETAVVSGAALGGIAAQLAVRVTELDAVPYFVYTQIVLVALPLLVGRYLAQHHHLVATLNRHNQQLRWKNTLLTEQERLRERLRIAQDMHDSLGQCLSLVSIQAAALEVAGLPEPHGQAVGRLADAARTSLDELHTLVGALRGAEDAPVRGLDAIDRMVASFRAAGVAVSLTRSGVPRPLSEQAEGAAYRVVQEGLTNAAKHAPGSPITTRLAWEPDALLLTVANPLPAPDGDTVVVSSGNGLTGLEERVKRAGGLLDRRTGDGEFRLFVMLPVTDEEPAGDGRTSGEAPAGSRRRTVLLGCVIAGLMFVALPVSLLVGVR